MQRHRSNPRPGWREQVEALGFTYHSHENGPYWDESACYELGANEVDALEAAAQGAGQELVLRRHEGYDHSYWFIQTFIEDHLKWHAERLRG